MIKIAVIRKILQLLHSQQESYRHIQKSLVIGSMEWKYYQSKINALTDLELSIIENYKLKNK